MFDSTPICSVCTTDWDDRLGYCETCAAAREEKEKADRRYHTGTLGLLEDNFS